MPVVDLEERFTAHLHQFFARHRPAEIRMIDVRQNRLARAPTLLPDHVQVALDDINNIA